MTLMNISTLKDTYLYVILPLNFTD